MSTSVIPSGGALPPSQGGYSTGPDWGGAPPAERGGGGVGPLIARTVSALKRYRWLIAAIFVAGSAAGIAVTTFVDPKYSVGGNVWIAQGSGASGPVQAPGLINNDLGWPDLVRSFGVLDDVVSRLALYVIPENPRDTLLFRALLPDVESLVPGRYSLKLLPGRNQYELSQIGTRADEVDRVVDQGMVGDSIGRSLGFRWQPTAADFRPADTFEFEIITPREASVKLQQDLSVTLRLNSNIMNLTLQGERAGLLASTLNSIMREFVADARRLKKENLTEISRTVDEQLSDAAGALNAAEVSLESFKIATITQPTDNVPIAPGVSIAANPVFASFFNERVAFDNVRRDRELLERIVADGRSRGGVLSVEALRGAPTLLSGNKELLDAISELSLREANLRTLRQTYTDAHVLNAKEIELINALNQQVIPAAANRMLEQLRSTEQEYNRRLAGASEELKRIPERTIEEQRRLRNVAVADIIFKDLQQRAVTAKLAERTVMPDVQMLDTAVAPRLPTSDTTASIVLIAVLASLGLGIALALLLDRLDGRFRYPEQATHDLGLDIVGAIPSWTSPRNQRARLEQASQMVESFRSLALSVRSAFAPGTPVQLTISSPGPGDGKSTISVNLANALADGGYRTLLIDGDIRRGQLHDAVNTEISQAPGLLDYLAGEAALADVIKQTDLHVNLSLIPCGTRRRHGPELLASQRMTTLLRELRTQFDAILVDCAPLGAGIDAFAVGSATGNMILVLRAGETDRRLAASKLATLDRLPIRLLGSVLNDIGESPEFRYYHYLEGYSSPDSVPEVGLVGSGVKAD